MREAFSVHSPESVAEAAALLDRYGEECRILAGGTELVVLLKLGLVSPSHLVDLSRLPLRSITRGGDCLRVSACVTHAEVHESSEVREMIPVLGLVEGRIGNVRVRSTGTVGGNIAFAEPSSDVTALLLLFGGRVRLVSTRHERTIDANDLFLHAFTTAIGADEILTTIDFALPDRASGTSYQRLALAERPTASVGCVITPDSGSRTVAAARMVIAASNPNPVRVLEAEEMLCGLPLTQLHSHEVREAVARAAMRRCEPVEDVTAGVAYKRHVTGVLARRALHEATEQVDRQGRTG